MSVLDICSFLMLQEVMEDDYFLQVSSARRLVNIYRTVRAIDLKFSQVKAIGLHAKMEGSTAAPKEIVTK
jgi:hypothetical protein